jgi:uncharacterized YigZ family protein
VRTIDSAYNATHEVNRSKFIAHLVPIDEFEITKARLKKEHPKANHIVYATRNLNEFDQIVENSSDDGEPKGCAGVPSLNVLRGKDMINVAVLIVRYFGGIKLGTGGMARAYASSVKNLLDIASLQSYEKLIEYSFKTSYSDIDKTMHKLKELGITQIDRDFGISDVEWKIKTTQDILSKVIID